MILGCIADDFTGASDLANTLARGDMGGGMATTLCVGIPGAAPVCDAAVVALKSRSIPKAAAVAQSLAALAWLQEQGCTQFFFKYCSTFDSTPDGNIGPVAEALLDALGAPSAIVCPAFPGAGRTLFQGHLFVNGRLLNESGMQHHPLTPMTDPDLCRWLARQTAGPVGLIPLATVRQGAAAIADAIAAQSCRLVVVDAIDDQDLRTIGAAAASHTLITGGSGVALGLPDNFRASGQLSNVAEPFVGVDGPGLVLSGSCSATSLVQISIYCDTHPALPLDPAAIVDGTQTIAATMDWIMRHRDASPAIYSTADPAAVAMAQGSLGRERVASAIETFFGQLAQAAVQAGFGRIVVGGGETSGAVVEALGLTTMRIGPEIAPGVPALAAGPLRLALKSGNFGGPGFYEEALGALS